ncbi:hypothetical protein F2P56_016644 [Juglans regia]|uniref:Uncharacterized protein n=1 Tax=Juglans regia TaxID=51240 RepID=A0A833XIH3_JUGRE|nr:hypothetical protein F2P56_016644 [Juglans regia]
MPPALVPLPRMTQSLSQDLRHLCPNFKIEYRSSLLSFFGCLYSSGLLYGMREVDRTKDLDLEDSPNLVKRTMREAKNKMGGSDACQLRQLFVNRDRPSSSQKFDSKAPN